MSRKNTLKIRNKCQNFKGLCCIVCSSFVASLSLTFLTPREEVARPSVVAGALVAEYPALPPALLRDPVQGGEVRRDGAEVLQGYHGEVALLPLRDGLAEENHPRQLGHDPAADASSLPCLLVQGQDHPGRVQVRDGQGVLRGGGGGRRGCAARDGCVHFREGTPERPPPFTFDSEMRCFRGRDFKLAAAATVWRENQVIVCFWLATRL